MVDLTVYKGNWTWQNLVETATVNICDGHGAAKKQQMWTQKRLCPERTVASTESNSCLGEMAEPLEMVPNRYNSFKKKEISLEGKKKVNSLFMRSP